MDPREPSGPIQTFAPGFLELLQLKNRGRNPAVLLDSVQPTIDMLQFYLQAQITSESVTSLTAAGGVITFHTVLGANSQEPQWVHNFSVYVPVGAATTDVASIALVLIDPVSSAVRHVLASKTFEVPITGANRFVALSTGGFWRGAGVGLGGILGCPGAGTSLSPQYTVRLSLRNTD